MKNLLSQLSELAILAFAFVVFYRGHLLDSYFWMVFAGFIIVVQLYVIAFEIWKYVKSF